MTNVEYLKKHNLYEAHEHFMRLTEAYIPIPEDLEEAGEEDNQQDGQPPMGGAPNGGGMGTDPAMGGQDPMGGQGMAGADGPEAQQGTDAAMGGDPNAMPGMDTAPQDDMGMGGETMGADEPMGDIPPMGDGAEPSEDGDTIDIDGLTKAQDKLNVKQNHIGRDLSKVDDKMKTLINTIQNLQSALDANNGQIEALKAEFEKRNPTQTEKLNLRSLDSYPFNVKPTDYWAKKAEEGGYEAYADNDEPTTQEYVITNDDVDNPSDDIAKTFFQIDDDDIQTLDKLFKL